MKKFKIALLLGFILAVAPPSQALGAGTQIQATTIRVGTKGAPILTLPSATDTLVGKNTTDQLTNKSVSGSANTLTNIGDSSLSTPYIKADGTRALSANWNAGAFDITATTFVGALTGNVTGAVTGNAATATALAANPTDCGANTYATTIAANGNLTCSAVSAASGLSGTVPKANGGTAQDNSSLTFPSAGTMIALTPVNHGVVISGAAAIGAVTTAGTAGHVLTSNGASADPTFQAPSPLAQVSVYRTSAGTSFGAAAPVPFATSVFTTIGTFSSSTFTFNTTGTFKASAHLSFSSMAWNVNEFVQGTFRLNGTGIGYDHLDRIPATATHAHTVYFPPVIFTATSGDTLDLLFTPGTAGNPTLDGVAARNWINIEKIGN